MRLFYAVIDVDDARDVKSAYVRHNNGPCAACSYLYLFIILSLRVESNRLTCNNKNNNNDDDEKSVSIIWI